MIDEPDFWRAVRAFVQKRVPGNDVDDVVQDIFVRASRSLAGLRDGDRAHAWLFAIARKAIAEHYRKGERQLPLEADDEGVAEARDHSAKEPENLSTYTGDHDVHEEVLSWLRPMAEAIAEPYRTALLKADFENVSQRDLARQLGISESGLKSRVQRARKFLAQSLERCCEVEFGTEGRAVAFRRRKPRPGE